MALLGIDLGGTKLGLAVFTEQGQMMLSETIPLQGRQGAEVGALLTAGIRNTLEQAATKGIQVNSIGICVPGISYQQKGTVWAPNIPGWENYPLLEEAQRASGHLPVLIDSDRACYILGEQWLGNARGCNDAIFLAVGTGIGAGILVNGNVLRGAHDIAGAIGWMALQRPYRSKYIPCGCFEYYASGPGIAALAAQLADERPAYDGLLKTAPGREVTCKDVFTAYEQKDPIAVKVLRQCIGYWGMAVANLVSLFNPEKIILGGGVFGPGVRLIPAIRKEALKWAQPVSIQQVSLEASALEGTAGVYGAGFLALQALHRSH